MIKTYTIDYKIEDAIRWDFPRYSNDEMCLYWMLTDKAIDDLTKKHDEIPDYYGQQASDVVVVLLPEAHFRVTITLEYD